MFFSFSTGKSAGCAVNRVSVYILLSILINLCALTYQVAMTVTKGAALHTSNKSALNFLSTAVPILLAILGYALDGDIQDGENAQLNVTRHAFSCSMRFSDMTTEWLALWIHFVWSGVMTMVFGLVAWREMGIVIAPLTQNQNGSRGEMKKNLSPGVVEATKQRRRLLRIAAMVSIVLLVMVTALLATSSNLEEWNQASDNLLACEIKEAWNTRDWKAYGLNEDTVVNVCSLNDLVAWYPCTSDCFWHPGITTGTLVCESIEYSDNRYPFSSLEEHAEQKILAAEQGGSFTDWLNPCSCSCDHLAPVENPSAVILTLAHIAQSLVVSVVGLNLGFRKSNLDLWTKFIQNRGTTGYAASPQAPPLQSVTGEQQYD
jgi:hypothetical protein